MKACGQPVYKLLGGQARDRLLAYANGWYGGARTPEEYADKAREVVARGYRAMKFDPFGTAWKELTAPQMDEAERIVAAVRLGTNTGSAPAGRGTSRRRTRRTRPAAGTERFCIASPAARIGNTAFD